jgi:hypothetical protein
MSGFLPFAWAGHSISPPAHGFSHGQTGDPYYASRNKLYPEAMAKDNPNPKWMAALQPESMLARWFRNVLSVWGTRLPHRHRSHEKALDCIFPLCTWN